MERRRRILSGLALITSGFLLTACATQQQAEGGTDGGTASGNYYNAAVAEAKKIAGDQKLASSLEMIGLNSGAEGQTLQQLYKAFTAGANVKVKYTGTPDASSVVQSRVQAGSPPDVADVQIGTALTYAKAGKLDNLSAAFGSDLRQNFDSSLLDDASYENKVFGVYQGFSNFMFWYNPSSYTGPKNPTSWSQITEWTKQEASKGKAVWCAAQNAGPASGFPGAQFIENIFIKKYGADLYQKWGRGQLSWTSPQVKDAFQQFGEIIGNSKNVSGGVSSILSTSIATGYNGLTASPATCQAAVWGSWVPGLIGKTAKPGQNIDYYKVPATDPKYSNDELFQSTVSIGFTDTPTTKAFLKFLASTAAQKYLASLDRWPVANKNVTSDAYTSPVLKKVAKDYFGTSGTTLAVGPNLLAAPATQNAYWKGVVSYLQSPGQLDSILSSIQATVK